MRSIRNRNREGDTNNGGGRGRGNDRGGRGGRQASSGRGRDHRTKTDESGRFFLEHLPGSEMEIRTNAKGYLNYKEEGVDVKLGQLIQVVMADGLRITGTVRTPDGEPVTTYGVRANRLRGLPDPNSQPVDLNDLLTKMQSGDLDEATRDKLREQMRSMRGGGDRGDRGGRGGRGGRGSGRGERGGRGDDDGEADTHPEGKFVADGLQEGIYQVTIDSADFARYESSEIEVRHAMAAPDLAITLDAGVYIAGVVLDDRGDPITRATVELRTASLDDGAPADNNPRGRGFDFNRMAQSWMRSRNGMSLRLEARTDEDGLFIIKHVPRGVFQLTTKADGFTQQQGEPFQLEGNKSDIEIELQPLGSIIGTVSGFRPDEIGEVSVGAVMLPEGGGMPSMWGRRGGSNTFKPPPPGTIVAVAAVQSRSECSGRR